MATTRHLYEDLRKSFISYEHSLKNYRDENLEEIIRISKEIGCKKLMHYASMSEDELSIHSFQDAKEVHTRLKNLISDYYNIRLLLCCIYGSIKILSNTKSQNDINDLVESIDFCMTLYLEYDGIEDSDILTIISFMREKGIFQCLNALKYNYSSSGYLELRELFYRVDDKYLPILDVVNALDPFLGTCPIKELTEM